MERSDRLSRSTKYILHRRSEVHQLFHFYTDQRDWYTWLEHLRAKAAADEHKIISFLFFFLHIYDDLSSLYSLSAWDVVVRFLFAFLYLHVVRQAICFATSPRSEWMWCILQNPYSELYHIHSDPNDVAKQMAWRTTCKDRKANKKRTTTFQADNK